MSPITHIVTVSFLYSGFAFDIFNVNCAETVAAPAIRATAAEMIHMMILLRMNSVTNIVHLSSNAPCFEDFFDYFSLISSKTPLFEDTFTEMCGFILKSTLF